MNMDANKHLNTLSGKAANLVVNPVFWNHIFNTVGVPVFICDTKGQLLVANQAYFHLAGVREEEAVGKFYWDVFPPGKALLTSCKNALLRKDYLYHEEIITVGEKIYQLKIHLIRDDDGKLLHVLNLLYDKTVAMSNLKLTKMYRTLSHCGNAFARVSDEIELNQEICRILIEDGGFRMAWVGYIRGDGHLDIIATSGIKSSLIKGMLTSSSRPKPGQGIVATAIQTGKVALSQDVQNDPSLNSEKTLALQLGYGKVIALPLIFDAHARGLLVVYGSRPDEFKEDILNLLTELANDLVHGIGNLRSRAEKMAIFEKLSHSFDNAIAAIASTVEMRDPYTAGHQRQVARLAIAIAAEMGMPKDQMKGLEMACVVHDIGKIHVPAEILTNPRPLSEAEFTIIKTHPVVGREILKEIDFPWPVAEIVYQHHERMDGSGYPRGLKGKNILLETRILMVADVVEAMISNRPYRPGYDNYIALQEISRNKGKLYDPKAVDACLRLFLEKDFKIG